MSRMMNDDESIASTSASTGSLDDDSSTRHINTRSPNSRNVEPFLSDNSRDYISHNQVRATAFRRIWGLLLTVLFVLLTIAILKIWEHRGYVSISEKTIFNFFSTVLSIALGLNFSDAFKSLASVMRWRILAHDRHSAREIDLILSSENFQDVAALAKESRSKPWYLWTCISWIFLFLCAQAAISLVSLTYDFGGGSDYSSVYSTKGMVVAPDLSCYFHNQTCPKDDRMGEQVRQGLAHSYGQLTLSSVCGHYNDISDVLKSKYKYEYYCRRTPNQQEFAYRFLEYNPVDSQKSYPWLTDRVITGSSGKCNVYKEINSTETPHGRNYTYWDGTDVKWIAIPYALEQPSATTYIYRGSNKPEKADLQQCGSRCIQIWAHRNRGEGQPSEFYQCPITISDVINTSNDAQQVPNNVALLAAASIGVNGRVQDGDWTQAQFSPFGSPWEIHFKEPDRIGANMAELAIGSIAYMASRNPLSVSFEGNVSHLGQSMNPHWQSAIPLLASIIVAHFALFAAAVYVSKSIIIKEGSLLLVARLLRPMVETLGDTGTVMTGTDISMAIDKDSKIKEGVVYGPRKTSGANEYFLDLASDIETLDKFSEGRHPDGRYH